MQNIPAVADDPTLLINAEFVKLKVYNDFNDPSDFDIYTFSSSYRYETIDGVVYSPLGGLMNVGIQQRDIRVTSADTSVSISGIDGDNMYNILSKKIKGSELNIIRGFYNSNYILTSNAIRFQGIVTSYNVVEERSGQDDNFTIAINASSFKVVLENRIAGRRTNNASWQFFNPSDTSMKNIQSLSGTSFDFGNKVGTSSINPSGGSLAGQTTAQTYQQGGR